MERARTSAAEYSTPEGVKSSERLNRSFSGRLPGAGGASMGAYRAWVETDPELEPDEAEED